jgi:ABC-type bacteriocin/lantibiotic exporter with double-glycine peptidase domain
MATLLSSLGKPTTLAEVGSGATVPERGLSMLDLQRLAWRHSLQLEGMLDREQRVDRWQFPWIAHMTEGAWQHYVLVENSSDTLVAIADPARGRVTLHAADFNRRWSGRALVIAKIAW